MIDDDAEIRALLQTEADAVTLAVNNICRFSPLSLLPPDVMLRLVSHYRTVFARAQIADAEGKFMLRGDVGKISEFLRGRTLGLPQLGAARQAVLLHVAFFVGVDPIAQCDALWDAIRRQDWESAHDALMLTDWPVLAGITDEDRKMVLSLARIMRTGLIPLDWTTTVH